MILGCLVFAQNTYGQDFSKTVKKAKRALGNYNLDQANKGSELVEAKDLILKAFESADAANDYNAQFYKGKILSEYVANENAKQLLDESYESNTAEIAFETKDAFVAALGLADKKYKKKEVLEALAYHAVNLSNEGIVSFQGQKFDVAYKALNASIEVKELLDANDMSSAYLSSDDDYNNQIYYTSLAAQLAKKNTEANDLYAKLIERGHKTSDIYEGLFRVNYDADADKAMSYLEEGRKMFPDSVNLLYAEINHYLKIGEIESLEGKLVEGIAKEPTNASLHVTLGNVYDRLFQKAAEEGKTEEAESNFNKAIAKYKDAIAINSKMGDAYYSIGALYFNKAASSSQELNKLADDFSKAGMKKYDAKSAEVLGYFEKALPWFEDAEKTSPNDTNTLIALKEIYAKQEKVDLSNEFKTRLEKVRAGEKVSSYFAK